MEGHSTSTTNASPASPSMQGAEGQAEGGEPLLSPTQSLDSPPAYPSQFVARLTVNYPSEFSSLTIQDETTGSEAGGAGPPKFDDLEPPPYNAVVKLPTYEEAQQEKMGGSDQGHGSHHPQHFHHPLGPPNGHDARSGAFNFMTSFNHPAGDSPYDTNTAELALGTDVYFFASFLIAFLFNWIGFLLLMCACHTVAGRYGALAGFGLSLAKWTLIVKHSTDLASNDNNWLWWLIMAFGVLICVRAVIQYLCIKREWHRLSRAAQERVVFFY